MPTVVVPLVPLVLGEPTVKKTAQAVSLENSSIVLKKKWQSVLAGPYAIHMPGVMLGAVREVRGPTLIDIACNPPLVESLDRRRFFFLM